MRVSDAGEDRAFLLRIQDHVDGNRLGQARNAIDRIGDPVIRDDWKIRRVQELLDGDRSEQSLREARDLLGRTIRELE